MVSAGRDRKHEFHNPYHHMRMIKGPQMFFGRRDTLRRLYTGIEDQQCLSLVGARRIGKSSVLQVLRNPENAERYGYDLSASLLAYIDTGEQKWQHYKHFLQYVCEQLVAQNQVRLAGVALPVINDTQDFSQFMDLLQSRELHPVLLLDEFEHITREQPFELDFFVYLRAQANAGKITFITASKDTLDKVCRSELVSSPFFNIFAILQLGALALEDALDLIRIPAERAGLAFRANECTWVLKMAGRQPFFIQRTCYYLFEARHAQGDAEVRLAQVAQQVTDDLRPHFEHAWRNMDAFKRDELAWEARRHDATVRKYAEFSESKLFRSFVCNECGIKMGELTVKALVRVLDKLDDAHFLGASDFGYLNIVYKQAVERCLSLPERGMAMQNIILAAIEELRPNAQHAKDENRWRLYNILCLHHKDHLSNAEIAARESISERHVIREHNRAARTLLNLLLQKEVAAKEELNNN